MAIGVTCAIVASKSQAQQRCPSAALEAYCDGTVAFEDALAPVGASRSARGERLAGTHRREQFSSLARAASTLALPFALPAGDVVLEAGGPPGVGPFSARHRSASRSRAGPGVRRCRAARL